MTKEEYIKEVQKIEAEKRAIDEEYRRSMPVQPHQVVVIDGKEYWFSLSFTTVCIKRPCMHSSVSITNVYHMILSF